MTLDRCFATLLFTDIGGSTRRASELGDRRWRELLQEHNTRVRHEVGAFAVPVGEREKALERLATLLSLPGVTSIPLLQIDPVWSPLHAEPGFHALSRAHAS